jgi:hypothetical protein
MFWSRLYRPFALTNAIVARGGYLSRSTKPEFKILLEHHTIALTIALHERATEFLRPPRKFDVAITKTAVPSREVLDKVPNACVTRYCSCGYLIAINGMLVFELYQLFLKLMHFDPQIRNSVRRPPAVSANTEEERRMAQVANGLEVLWKSAT